MSWSRFSVLRTWDDLQPSTVTHGVGVYRLYSTRTGPVRYVGRSDGGLYAEILQTWNRFSVPGVRLVYVQWRYYEDAWEAYEGECREFHRHHGPDLINQIHPAAPAGYPPRCPVCR